MKQAYSEKLKNSVILITGGTGSFGNTVTASLLTAQPRRVIIFSRDEKKQFDMRNLYDSPLLRFVIGDVRDSASVHSVMDGVDYVFHAAALKQVPSCEFFPQEAVKTNILGASNVISSALEHHVKRLVILSTDKAVYPINTMGMTKALMEKTMIAASRKLSDGSGTETVVCGVRYGNVLYSRGSVIPYFVDCIRQGKILPVTNYGMTRFLLSLSDAVDLVMHALVSGKSGHMYVRKSPAATLDIVAQALCHIFHYKKGYAEVGIRAGEKMHETLISVEEMTRAKDVSEYFEIPPESQGLDYNRYFFNGKKVDMEAIESFRSDNTKRLNLKEAIALLRTIPEIIKALKHHSVSPS